VRAVILYNPRSGKGRGEQVACNVGEMLRRRSFQIDMMGTEKETAEDFRWRAAACLNGADLMVVAGGDGTLHRSLPALAGSGVAVYHLAMGTENLFSRQFGMNGTVETLEKAVEAWSTQDVDLGAFSVNGAASEPFAIMCSVGPDASIVRKLDATRTGPISHLTYLGPILTELANPWLPRLAMEVDGETLEGRGMVVVANSRQYGMRLDPAERASMTDGLLDVVFAPAAGSLELGARVLGFRLRRHGKDVVYKQAKRVRVIVEADTPAFQVDGECGHAKPGRLVMDLEVLPKALKVLTSDTPP
jgi:diacylglycerol kinase (ATP)